MRSPVIEVIRTSEQQREEFRRTWSRLRGMFRHQRATQSVDQMDDYKGAERFRGYGLNLYTGPNSGGIDLRGPSPSDPNRSIIFLHFNTYSSRGGVPGALLARHDGGVGLYHSGLVNRRAGRAPPFNDSPVNIDGRQYFHVADLDDPDFFERLVRFHLSRMDEEVASNSSTPPNENTVETLVPLPQAIDYGPFRGGSRSSVLFEAHCSHSKGA